RVAVRLERWSRMSHILRAASLLLLGLTLESVAQPALAQSAAGGVLPIDGDASANWKMAGMLSVGGIPNRTTICATVEPLGSGHDDTSDIQNAINSCPDEQVVSLAAGTFTIAEGNFVLIPKDITLRGAGPGATILTRKGGATLGTYQPGKNPS